MVSFTYRSLFPRRKEKRYPLKNTLGDHVTSVHDVTKREISSPQWEPKHGSLVFHSVEW